MATLFHWVACSGHALTLIEVESLLKFISKDRTLTIESLPEVFGRFLCIGDPGYDAEFYAGINSGRLDTKVQDLKDDDDNSDNPDQMYNDGGAHRCSAGASRKPIEGSSSSASSWAG